MNPAVVVPVRGGGPLTGRNLAEIAAAARRSRARLFVVDNGMLRCLRTGLRLPDTVIVDCATIGSYRARNTGIKAALSEGHDPVLLTDADCRPLVGWPMHLIELSALAGIGVTVAPPQPATFLGQGAHADYLERLTEWAGGPIRCGTPINTMDTRACVVRAEVFRSARFDERLRFAGDALFARKAIAAGYRVLGCHHSILTHDAPISWAAELRKYSLIAAALVEDLRSLERSEVLRYLPEHAHLLLPPRAGAIESARDQMRRAASLVSDPSISRLAQARDAEPARALYVAVRRLGWLRGWQQADAARRRAHSFPKRHTEPPTTSSLL